MYFPFLTCEGKCGAAALDIADRQNAYNMTLAVRGIVELFCAVKREDEVNQKKDWSPVMKSPLNGDSLASWSSANASRLNPTE